MKLALIFLLLCGANFAHAFSANEATELTYKYLQPCMQNIYSLIRRSAEEGFFECSISECQSCFDGKVGRIPGILKILREDGYTAQWHKEEKCLVVCWGMGVSKDQANPKVFLDIPRTEFIDPGIFIGPSVEKLRFR